MTTGGTRKSIVQKPANDNNPPKGERHVTCDFMHELDILPGEAMLIARHMDDLLMNVANDNEE